MSKTVYAVVISDYDIYSIVGIYTSQEEAEKAEAFFKKYDKMWKSYYHIDEYLLDEVFNEKDFEHLK